MGTKPTDLHNMYLVENLAINGIIIWQDESGKIFEGMPSRKTEKLADSLGDYILSRR